MTQKKILHLSQAILDKLRVDMQTQPLANLQANLQVRGIRVKQGEADIEKKGADRLWLLKLHLFSFSSQNHVKLFHPM
jgi:hypothetical protein